MNVERVMTVALFFPLFFREDWDLSRVPETFAALMDGFSPGDIVDDVFNFFPDERTRGRSCPAFVPSSSFRNRLYLFCENERF